MTLDLATWILLAMAVAYLLYNVAGFTYELWQDRRERRGQV